MLAMFTQAQTQRRSLIAWLLRGKLLFVSYRRVDSTGITGRICDHLCRVYGSRKVIRDIDSIPPGCPFRDYIDDAITSSRAVLAIIGPDWHPSAMICHELRSALRNGIPIIPVLVRGAKMPEPSSLPAGLRPIADLQATRVRSDGDFHHDIQRLIRAISRRT